MLISLVTEREDAAEENEGAALIRRRIKVRRSQA